MNPDYALCQAIKNLSTRRLITKREEAEELLKKDKGDDSIYEVCKYVDDAGVKYTIEQLWEIMKLVPTFYEEKYGKKPEIVEVELEGHYDVPLYTYRDKDIMEKAVKQVITTEWVGPWKKPAMY